MYVLFHCAEQFGRQGITGFTGVIANLVYGVEFAIVSHVLADQGPYQMVGTGDIGECSICRIRVTQIDHELQAAAARPELVGMPVGNRLGMGALPIKNDAFNVPAGAQSEPGDTGKQRMGKCRVE